MQDLQYIPPNKVKIVDHVIYEEAQDLVKCVIWQYNLGCLSRKRSNPQESLSYLTK